MPASWPEYTLKEVCLRITDGSHQSPKSVDTGLPMASVKDLTPFGINIDTCREISERDFKELVRQGCQPKVGDVLIAKDGATALDTVCELRQSLNVVLLSSVAILRPDPNKICPTYLRYYLDCNTTREYLKNGFITGAAIPRVILEDFKRARIKLPALPTQRNIAAILSAYDDLIENNNRRIKILEEMAQALYREWFVNFRFPGHEKVRMVDSPLGEIPEGWKLVKFIDIADVLSGGTPKTAIPEFWNGEIPFFTPRDAPASFYVTATDKRITELGLSKCNSDLYPKNTVFITARGTVGKIAMIPVDMAMNQSCYAIIGKNGIGQYYIFLAIRTYIDQLKQNATGAVFDTIVV